MIDDLDDIVDEYNESHADEIDRLVSEFDAIDARVAQIDAEEYAARVACDACLLSSV